MGAAARASGFRMPMGLQNRQNHLDMLLDTLVRLRMHGYVVGTGVQVGEVDPARDAAAIQAIWEATGVRVARTPPGASGLTVLAPLGVMQCCDHTFGFLDRRTVCAELRRAKDYFVRPDGGKRVVRDTVSHSVKQCGFEKPTPTALAKDAINSLDDTKGILTTCVKLFVDLGTGPEVVVAVWSVFMDLTPGTCCDPTTRQQQAEVVARYAAAQSAGVARGGPDTTFNPLGGIVQDLVARMHCDTLRALLFVCMARQRAEVVTYSRWDQGVVAAGMQALGALHGPGVVQSACRAWVCFSCCVMYVVPASHATDTDAKRAVLGAHGVCCDPCPSCYDVGALGQATCSTCSGTGIMATCAHQSPTDSRGGKPKRCVAQLVSFDLAAGALRVLDVALALCVVCGCKFRLTSGCWSNAGPTCPLCLRFRERHGALPVPADVSPMAATWGPCVPSARVDIPRTCCVCGVLVAHMGGGCTVRVAHGPDHPALYNRLQMCRVHNKAFLRGLPDSQGGPDPPLVVPTQVFTRQEVHNALAAGGVRLQVHAPGQGLQGLPGFAPACAPPLWMEKFWFPSATGLPRVTSDPAPMTTDMTSLVPPPILSRFRSEVPGMGKEHALALLMGDSIKVPMGHTL